MRVRRRRPLVFSSYNQTLSQFSRLFCFLSDRFIFISEDKKQKPSKGFLKIQTFESCLPQWEHSAQHSESLSQWLCFLTIRWKTKPCGPQQRKQQVKVCSQHTFCCSPLLCISVWTICGHSILLYYFCGGSGSPFGSHIFYPQFPLISEKKIKLLSAMNRLSLLFKNRRRYSSCLKICRKMLDKSKYKCQTLRPAKGCSRKWK